MEKRNDILNRKSKSGTDRRAFIKTGFIAAGTALLSGAANASASDAKVNVTDDMADAKFLFVKTARDVVFKNEEMTLKGINPTTIFFSIQQYPVRSLFASSGCPVNGVHRQ